MQSKRILLIIGGGVAAYKTLDLIRRLRAEGAEVVPVMTRAAEEFVTPLSVSALAGEEVHRDLFDLTTETKIGHIQLSRQADLVLVAPATADLMAKMAAGLANDLASTLLLATDKPVWVAPAMNVRMWDHPATRRNRQVLADDGIGFIGPDSGPMACGEVGEGRMAEPAQIVNTLRDILTGRSGHDPVMRDEEPLRLEAAARVQSLRGRRILVTSGPTHEPIDPVRYIANRSSGAQGTAIAAALRDLGAEVVFITGPAEVPPPEEVEVIRVETAQEMRDATERALPVDAAVMAAAVADWRVANQSGHKIKKQPDGRLPTLEFAENPDILAWISGLDRGRPHLVVGFAAETNDVVENATAKRRRKGCDWIVANDVRPQTGIMGGAHNRVTLITPSGPEPWPEMPKDEVARRLANRIAGAL